MSKKIKGFDPIKKAEKLRETMIVVPDKKVLLAKLSGS